MTELQKSGRRVGNVQRSGLGARSINLMLTLITAVLEDQLRQGTLPRNVGKLVERVRQTKPEMKTWTEAQVTTFLEHISQDRLSAALQLSLYGLRRGEVLGLCGRMWTSRPSRSRFAEPVSRSPERVSWRSALRQNGAAGHCRWATLLQPPYGPSKPGKRRSD